MKAHDKYLKFVQWSDEDEVYIGYCPDLFPHGGVCHNEVEIGAYAQLCEIVEDVVSDYLRDGEPLPEVTLNHVPRYDEEIEAVRQRTSAASV
jgi:predicted RNase H-like HicB family nuclease